jgi:DUF1365 family protein
VNSHLLEGKVRHRRLQPFVYELEHDVFYFALDLGELDELTGRSHLVRRNGRGLVSFRDGDHLPKPATDLDRDIRDHLVGEGIDATGWKITLITNLRVLGYVFNPASFYLCRDADGDLRVVVVEVHNTHLERHCYTLKASATEGPFVASMDKTFYVSPFIEMEGHYGVRIQDDPSGLRIAITESRGPDRVLSTGLVLRRIPFSDRALSRLLLRHPLVTIKTITLIHWHALRLWLRGARFHRHGDVAR